jgi:hypothetical protein
LRNLIYSLVASLAVVLILVTVVVRPDPEQTGAVNYHDIAQRSQVDSAEVLIDPELPAAWTANAASLTKAADGVSTWHVGFITPEYEYIGVKQGIEANQTWVSGQLDEHLPTGTMTVAGLEWTVYDYRESEDPGNLAFAMVSTLGASDVVLYGTAPTTEFELLATEIVEQER